MAYTYEYPRPSLTVDCIIFGLDDRELKVLLIQRKHPPFAGKWALPGGFVDMGEDLMTAALRELEEETGVKDVFIEQLYTFGAPNRDPRGRVVSVAYYALVNLREHPAQAASDAEQADWFNINELPPLAFDHDHIMEVAIKRLHGKLVYQPIGFELLPQKFTLTELQHLYETVLGVKINKRNFRTKILKMDILEQCERQQGVAHRPAFLYQFNEKKYNEFLEKGFVFEIGGIIKKTDADEA
jgi:8-oxo-dGTP diphosphatase